tara:strand:- start:534 stop:728 length:195 start_codon:yes stop_codon:yes gene_type:complete
MTLENKGHSISDCDGRLRDISEIVEELKAELEELHESSAMSEYQLVIIGKREMLSEVIQYLERV